MMPDTQLSAALAEALCFPSTPSALAVAVSGGADSMALLLLTAQWAKSHNVSVTALTVDHRLRNTSTQEALQVKTWCAAQGIAHHILTWDSPKALQSDARKARYRLLTDWCTEHEVDYLLTAHHRGDQAETLFFRLARGSNLRGLACMPTRSMMHGIHLIRPLLGIGKGELISYLQQCTQPWIEDPSNRDPHYTRNVIRAQLQSLDNADDIEIRAAAVASAFGRIRAILDKKIESAFTSCITLLPGDQAHIDIACFTNLPPEIARLLLGELIQRLSGQEHPPRTVKLERLYAWLMSPETEYTSLAHLTFSHLAAKGQYIVRPES